jgi:DNA-directed RNA polymerase sigma subunit (sigma70/sigma32)
LEPYDEVEKSMVDSAIREELEALPELHRLVIELRFGLTGSSPAMIGYIAQVTGLPEHQVGAVIAEALEILAEKLARVEEMRAA